MSEVVSVVVTLDFSSAMVEAGRELWALWLSAMEGTLELEEVRKVDRD